MKKIALFLLLSAGLLAFAPPAVFRSYVSFKDTKLGQIKADTKGKGGRETEGWFGVISFHAGSETPGKRHHQPFTITRETDAASPKLWQALSANEVFETVTIQTVDAKNNPTKTIILSKAELTAVHVDGSDETFTLTYDHLTTQ